MPGTTIDGNDVFRVYETLNEAIGRARKGEGPSLIECKTYQYEGPFSGEDAEEKEKDWQEKDPILRFEKNVLDNELLSKSELEKIQIEEENAVNESVDFALTSTDPPIEEAYSDVFNN
jgi:pyruvate dehydrogenase E1 component alpha subunit